MNQPGLVIAHGIGERGDLPLPLYVFSWGLGLALVLSFVLLGLRWTEPRLARAGRGRAVAGPGATAALHTLARTVGLAFYLLCLYAAFFGANSRADNIIPVTTYVTVWVGMLVVGGLAGDLWAAINPFVTLASMGEKVASSLKLSPRPGPSGVGHWPATVGLIVFLFYELSHPDGADPRALGWLLLVHSAGVLVAGELWGADWVRRHEPFSVLFDQIGAMGALFTDSKSASADDSAVDDSADDDSADDARGLMIRPLMSGLATAPVVAGTGALLLTVIGGTSFDGFSESRMGRDVFGQRTGWELAWVELAAMLVSIALVAALYALGVWWTTRVSDLSFNQSWRAFAPSLVPIVFGYGVAHYFQLFSDEIQSWVFRLSDPFGRDWDLFGGSDALIWRIDPDIVAWIQVAAILLGHVGAVVVAHDRALETMPAHRSAQSQFAMLFVMVAYSSLGLWLLLSA